MALLNLVIEFTEADMAEIMAGPKGETGDGKAWVYQHMLHGEGMCADCAPWLNVACTGDGTDGVPVPPLHPHCRCYLMPRVAFETAADGEEIHQQGLEHLASLPHAEVANVVGPVRAGLMARGKLTIHDMFHQGMPLTLGEMGYTQSGLPMNQKTGEVLRYKVGERKGQINWNMPVMRDTDGIKMRYEATYADKVRRPPSRPAKP